MEFQTFQRSKYLNNTPDKKLQIKIEEIKELDITAQDKTNKIKAINRFYESNIPISYWDVWMEQNFIGDKRLMEKYKSYIESIKSNYLDGKSICFIGSHGVGKTFAICSILKIACLKNYNCLYTTLSDLVSISTSYNDEKNLIKKELNTVDFLAIDEFDSRFVLSSQASELYASTLENVFRARIQNKLPTLIASNSPNPIESFNGQLKESLRSIFNYLEMFPVLGQDFRSKK